MTAEAFAPAKVNLALHVTGRRPDGYHLLDSLVVFADVGDRVCAAPSADVSLRVTGPMAAGVPTGEDNLVLRAARLLRARRGVTAGAAIVLEKHLPHGAGLGGGSSDAAAAIRALAELWDVAPLSGDEALSLGADLPACLAAPGPLWVSGIGQTVRPTDALPERWLVLAHPGAPLDTARVYAGLNASAWTGPLRELPEPRGFDLWLREQRNDLAAPAMAILPEVAALIRALRALPGCRATGMSGSGSACWGLFATAAEAEAGAAALAAQQPEIWVRPAGVLGQATRATT